MTFKDIAEAKQFCKLYALAKKVELVVVQSDKRRLRYTCDAEGCPFLLFIYGDLTTPGVSVKTLVDHTECGTTYGNSLVDYSTIALYFKEKLQSNPKYKGLLEAVRTVLPEAHKRYCARHIEANWCKRWDKSELKKLLRWVAWSSFTEEFEDQLQEIKEVDEDAGQDLIDKYPPKAWCRAYLDTVCKNQVVDNNFIESFNAWTIEASPKSELLFIEYLKISKVCKAKQGKQPTKKQGKQAAKQGKETGRGKKRQPRRVAEDDDEDPMLRLRTISEEAFLTRLRKRQNPQEPIGSKVIGFRGDIYGVSEPTNLPIAPTGLT
ncbi:hypothetical protein MTR67_042602 [Solanum verrucosum]|uniref:Transposase MuDR plant domain-containing protein n=1 Tax=Solanum verrucosum TaxID=315347 RepID=A0AAF0ZRA5_SOLVR|nr:hypothetical protein MTR67_042602 [Solanum verrucosum]